MSCIFWGKRHGKSHTNRLSCHMLHGRSASAERMSFVLVQPEYARTAIGRVRDFVRVGPESARAETAANLCHNLLLPISPCETDAPGAAFTAWLQYTGARAAVATRRRRPGQAPATAGSGQWPPHAVQLSQVFKQLNYQVTVTFPSHWQP